jgi:hypothetical protein
LNFLLSCQHHWPTEREAAQPPPSVPVPDDNPRQEWLIFLLLLKVVAYIAGCHLLGQPDFAGVGEMALSSSIYLFLLE